MKSIVLIASLVFGMTQGICQEQVSVKKKSSVELTYEDFETSVVQIKNKSLQTIDVKVEDATTKKWIKGFGLGPKGKVSVDVKPGQVLIFTNDSKTKVDVALDFIKRKAPKEAAVSNKMITFTLHNSSAKSIPLVIPAVMNPNLSPFSNSGVKLKVGQKIYYKKNGKKKLLLEVDDSISDGEKLDIAKLIKKLEKEK
ncbi:MAG: hypothetical protein P8P74_05295 [Crocinitomicaceae bacterium]|nr:hypothetical protein [Crocinitomicaceae bacterium]